MLPRFVALSCFTLLLTACSQSVQTQRSYLPAVLTTPAGSGTLLIRVTVHRDARSPNYLSPSSKGMTVVVKGPTKFTKTAGLTVGANGCKSKLMDLQCALRVTN